MENRDWMRSSPSWLVVVVVPIFHFLFFACLHAQNAKKEKADMLVAGGTVVTMNAERRIIEDGAVAVKGDAIVAVGSRANIEAKYAATQTINAGGKLVLPGFINGHTHVPMTLLRGLRDDVTLDDAAALARKYGAPILIHVAEMKKELDNSRAQNGTTPVQYLDKLGILGPDIVAAHCIFVDETDRKILAQRQVGCVHNPSSNMMLASGVAPVI